MQADLSEILHNVADHTETFFRFLGETDVSEELKTRLIDHIVLEESENTTKLQQLHQASPTALTQKLLDHSFILQKIMGDATMPLDLKQELLHHFMEEHLEWQKELGSSQTQPDTSHAHAETVSARAHNRTAVSSESIDTAKPDTPRYSHKSKESGGTRSARESGYSRETGSQTNDNGWTVGPMWNQGG